MGFVRRLRKRDRRTRCECGGGWNKYKSQVGTNREQVIVWLEGEVACELPVAGAAAGAGDLSEGRSVHDRGCPYRAGLPPSCVGAAERHLVPDVGAIRLKCELRLV